jgi:hypothetical protein
LRSVKSFKNEKDPIPNPDKPEKTNQITNNIQLPKTQIQKKDASRIHKLFRPLIRKFDNVLAHLGGHVACDKSFGRELRVERLRVERLSRVEFRRVVSFPQRRRLSRVSLNPFIE